jgi:hypothetical protein
VVPGESGSCSGKGAQGITQQEMAEDGADNAERNGRHDDQRLDVAAERDGQQGKDHQQGKHETDLEVAEVLLHVCLASLKTVTRAGVGGCQLWSLSENSNFFSNRGILKK